VRSERGDTRGRYIRLLDPFGFDMPSREVILEHADETVFRVVAPVGAADRTQTISVILLKERCEAQGSTA
jgi:hypothetical protein